MYTVEFYETEDGDKPVFDFMMSLEPKMRAKVGAMMQLLAEKGNELRKPYTEHLDDGIIELRTIQGNNISRALFFFYVGHRIIITNGFIKKRKKLHLRKYHLQKPEEKTFIAEKRKGVRNHDDAG